jgi:hypothetical protein
MLAAFVRFCADGCLRGPDNCVVALCVDGLWQVGGRTHSELNCDGSVRVRVIARMGESPAWFGPFQNLRTIGGVLHSDKRSLHACMPGRASELAGTCYEVSLFPCQELLDGHQ